MTRSRRPLCGHHDDDPVYVTWIDPDYEPQDRAKVEAALAHLAEVLNTLPGPVDGAVADLTTRDIATMLSRAPLDRRKHALSAIGIPVAPRIGRAGTVPRRAGPAGASPPSRRHPQRRHPHPVRAPRPFRLRHPSP